MKLNDLIYDMTIKDVAREFCYNPEWVRQMIRLGVLAPAAIKRRKEYRLNRELVVECLTKAKEPKQKQTQLPIQAEGGYVSGNDDYGFSPTPDASVVVDVSDLDKVELKLNGADDDIDDIEFPDDTFPGVDGLGTGYGDDAEFEDIFGDAEIYETPAAYRDANDEDDDIIFDV